MRTFEAMVAAATICGLGGTAGAAGFRATESDGRIEVRDGETLVLAWQRAPLADPKGGGKFAASAFLHPLCTPSGFELTRVQPPDHLHHFGVWWPWKHLEVDGAVHNCWEIQEGRGRNVAVAATIAGRSDDEVVLELVNRHEVMAGGRYVPAVEERTRLRLARSGRDAYVLDLAIDQRAAEGREVTVPAYRYSGFSWRGTGEWNKDNSRMRTSEGRGRDDTNHQPARWVAVDGKAGDGRATMLMMSAAARDGGEPELLRVWDSKAEKGAPFVNFNPVVAKALPISAAPVAHRRYRLVMADRAIEPEEAERLWREWKD